MNKTLWDSVCRTDPAAVKPITGKQYKGNSPKPYWIVERLTETFGPCGIGWGFTILNERMEHLTDSDVLHVALVRLWYVYEGQRGELEQIGQTKAVYEKSSGGALVDEDAPKKSVTDALVKCASYLGFAGDIFSGRWDDSKYVAEVRKEYEDKRKPEPAIPANLKILPTDGAGDGMPDEVKADLESVALEMIHHAANGSPGEAVRMYYEIADNDSKVYVWKLLAKESKLRAFIKANSPHQAKEAA